MIKVIYSRGGIKDLRYFKSKSEFDDWFKREKVIWPDAKILKKEFLKDGVSNKTSSSFF